MTRTALFIAASGLAIGLATGTAQASEKLRYEPAEAWIKPITLNQTPGRELTLASSAILNRSIQAKFSNSGDTLYYESAVRIQRPAGLSIGRPTVEWDPDGETVTINKAEIIRGGRIIDLLADGQTFVIVRRETDLDYSILDGRLTATLQPEGLQIGDIIDFAYSKTRRFDFLKNHSEMAWSGIDGSKYGKLEFRAIWPNSKSMHWRLSDDLSAPHVTKAANETELTLNFDGYKRPNAPDQAPDRYSRFGEIEFSEFSSWSEVSALMAPYWEKAETLRRDSPLKDEVAKIKAQSSDPKVQAAAALQLVQDDVHYAIANANDANDIPPAADLTWTRRFGDCKAKTALLVALLRALGIAADPVAADTEIGDGMNERLPALDLFNHAIVRARIGGKTYWLDGTHRDGGLALDNLDVPDKEWALPFSKNGEDLQPIPVPPAEKPQVESHLRIDASAGIGAPAPAHAEFIARGDFAMKYKQTYETKLPETVETELRAYWTHVYRWITLKSVSQTFDPATGELLITMDGTAQMPWLKNKKSGRKEYEPNSDGIGEEFDIDREPGPRADAPVSVDYPVFTRRTESIVLPNGGKGFSIDGDAVDKTLAGWALKRSFDLKDGVFTIETSDRSLVPEIPFSEAKAATDEMNALSDSEVLVQAPAESGQAGAAVANGQPAAAEVGDTSTQSQDQGNRLPERQKRQPNSPADSRLQPLPPEPTLDDLAKIYGSDVR